MEMLIILVLAFGAMWLMTSRTRKQQREAADFRANLEVGQEVMTGSGLYGTIVDVDGDTITLESMPGNQSRWIRAAIAKLVPPADEVEDTDEVEDDEAEYEDEYAADEYVADDAVEYDTTDDDDDRVRLGRETGGATRYEVPDDLSTLDERRPDDGTDRR
jgi:preprotein translocase subunit YajC